MDIKDKTSEAIKEALNYNASEVPILMWQSATDANIVRVIVLYKDSTIVVALDIRDSINKSLALHPELNSVTAVIEHEDDAERWIKLDKPEYEEHIRA